MLRQALGSNAGPVEDDRELEERRPEILAFTSVLGEYAPPWRGLDDQVAAPFGVVTLPYELYLLIADGEQL